MCRLTERTLYTPPCQKYVSPPAVTYIQQAQYAACVTESGYDHENGLYRICVQCFYEKPASLRVKYRFAVEHYMQINRPEFVAECDQCWKPIAIVRPISSCIDCPGRFSWCLVLLARDGETIRNVIPCFVMISRNSGPADITISPRLAQFGLSLYRLK